MAGDSTLVLGEQPFPKWFVVFVVIGHEGLLTNLPFLDHIPMVGYFPLPFAS